MRKDSKIKLCRKTDKHKMKTNVLK